MTDSFGSNALTKLMFSTGTRFGYDLSRFTHRLAILRGLGDVTVSPVLFSFNRLGDDLCRKLLSEVGQAD